MGYAIFRAAKRNARGTRAMLVHALRETAVANAVPGQRPAVLAGHASTAAALAELAGLKARAQAAGQRWRKDQVTAIDMLITASPDDARRLGPDGMRQYLADGLKWVQQRWPTWRVLAAAVHLDETTPHLQIIAAPTDQDGRFRGSQALGGPSDMSKHQDEFHAAVGARYGLLRGEKRSKAQHVPVRTFYAHAARVRAGQADELEPVPPAPEMTLRSVASGEYVRASREREAVIKRNAARVKATNQALRQLKAIHPEMVARNAARYREVTQAKLDAQEAEKRAQKLQKQAQDELASANYLRRMADDRVKVLGAMDDKARAQLIDKFSRYMPPDEVAKIGQALGIQLQAGRPLCDQIRKAGKAVSLLDAAAKIDQAMDGKLTREIRSIESDDPWERPSEAPKP